MMVFLDGISQAGSKVSTSFIKPFPSTILTGCMSLAMNSAKHRVISLAYLLVAASLCTGLEENSSIVGCLTGAAPEVALEVL